MTPAQNAYNSTAICFTAWLLRKVTVSPPLPQLMTYNHRLILQCMPVDVTGFLLYCSTLYLAYTIRHAETFLLLYIIMVKHLNKGRDFYFHVQ